MRRQAHFHLHKGTQERLVWKMCVPSMRCVKKKRYKCVHNSQACFVPLRSRYIFTYNWQKFVTDKDKCLPRSICCTAYCHTYQVTKKLKTRTNTLNNFTRLFTYFVTHANEITRLTFLWRNIPWGNIFEVCVCVCVCVSLSLSLSLSVGLLLTSVSPMQRPLYDNTKRSQETDIHGPDGDSNTQYQQASGRKPTP